MANALVDLVTLAKAKTYLAATGAVVPDDVTLGDLITGVSAQIQNYLSRNLVSQSYTVTLNGNGRPAVNLPNTPITAISALSVDGAVKAPAPNATAYGYVFSDTQVMLRGDCFSRGFQNVSLTYTAGYSVIPPDVVNVTLEGLSAVVQAISRDPGVRSEKAGDTAYVYGGADVDALSNLCLTPNVTSALNQMRRVAPC